MNAGSKLINLDWIGKISGAVLGWLLTRSFVGMAVGAFLGHMFDAGLREFRRSSGTGVFEQISGGARKQTFFETTFLVMGHLAKVDGRVSEEEIRAARSVMHRMQLRPEEVSSAIELFSRGKDPDYPIDEQLLRLRQACRGNALLLRTFLEIQLDLALSKGGIQPDERELLWHIAGVLNVGRVELAQLEAVLRAQRSFGYNEQAPPQRRSLNQAYKALNIESSATDKEVKTAYRRLMNQHHPDKLVAKGLPDSMLELAKERTREIRAAYELIREDRQMK